MVIELMLRIRHFSLCFLCETSCLGAFVAQFCVSHFATKTLSHKESTKYVTSVIEVKAIIFLVFALFIFSGSEAQVQSSAFNLTLKALLSHSVPEVTVPQFKEMSTVLLLDAREKDEYEVSHIANAKLVGYDHFKVESLGGIDKKKKIVVYCSVGYRSEKISEKLKHAGFTDVSNLYGGIFEWVNQGNLVVDSDGKATEDIHAYNKTWGVWLDKGNKVYEKK